jgi:hypothetical protein
MKGCAAIIAPFTGLIGPITAPDIWRGGPPDSDETEERTP